MHLHVLFLLFYNVASYGFGHSANLLQEELLWASLSSQRVQACDGERVTLHCPRHTHIHVDTGFYGRVVPPSELCPDREEKKAFFTPMALGCDVIHAKSKVSEVCDKRRKCTILVDANTFEEDPCPGTGKYLQMSYKCRPVSFESASFCEGERMAMECREGRRLAIHSAHWGRSSSEGCAQSTPDCSHDVLPKILSCHGQATCSLDLTEKNLGKTCNSTKPNALHVSFVCVNDEIFSEDTLKGQPRRDVKHFKYLEGSGFDLEPKSEIIKYDDGEHSHHLRLHDKPEVPKSYGVKEWTPPEDISVEEHIEHSMKDPNDLHLTPLQLSDASVHPTTPVEPPTPEENPNFVGVAHDVMLVAKFLEDNPQGTLWAIGIGVAACVLLPLMICLCCCKATKNEKNDGKMRYSIETSQLFARGSQMLDGPSHLIDLGDLPEDTFVRYSQPSTRSTHYDF